MMFVLQNKTRDKTGKAKFYASGILYRIDHQHPDSNEIIALGKNFLAQRLRGRSLLHSEAAKHIIKWGNNS